MYLLGVALMAGLVVVAVVAPAAEEGQPTNIGMLDSEVDFIIGLGRGVMYDLDLILIVG
jgi:hypothetical protein